MKTLSYRLFGRNPGSFDDWVDSLEKERAIDRPFRISLSLARDEELVEDGYILHKLSATYDCHAECRRICRFCKNYGGYLESDGERRKSRCLACAERRLEKDLVKLARIGIGFPVPAAQGEARDMVDLEVPGSRWRRGFSDSGR